MALQVGDILGDYRVIGLLGRGGMGRVYRVHSLLTDRDEAMKVVLDEDPLLADRFLREIKVHASLQHPNIAAMHAARRLGDYVVMFMELVEGVTLEDRIRQAALDVPTALRYLTQVLSALAYAHARGVIHRDIKPANILVTAGGVIKLTDFGIARVQGVERLTNTGIALGTLSYISPEQVRGEPVDARSDIYAAGMTAYEMLTGRRAINGESIPALMTAQLNFMPPAPANVNPAVPVRISEAILRAIAKDPGQRFQSTHAFRDALDPARPIEVSCLAATAAPGHADSADLAEMETRLSRVIGPIARRLVADAARRHATVAEIRQTLAAQIDDPAERAAFCAIRPALPSRSGSPAGLSPAALDRVAQLLANYIGPIAKVVVARATRVVTSADGLWNLLADEVSAPADRKQFLASVRSIL